MIDVSDSLREGQKDSRSRKQFQIPGPLVGGLGLDQEEKKTASGISQNLGRQELDLFRKRLRC